MTITWKQALDRVEAVYAGALEETARELDEIELEEEDLGTSVVALLAALALAHKVSRHIENVIRVCAIREAGSARPFLEGDRDAPCAGAPPLHTRE